MRTFAKEVLAAVLDDIDESGTSSVFDLDLAGGYVHPAIRVGTWHVLVSAGTGEALDNDTFDLFNDQSLIWSVGCHPTLEADYDTGAYHELQNLADRPAELFSAVEAMVKTVEGFDTQRVHALAEACVYECGGEMGLMMEGHGGEFVSTVADPVQFLTDWMAGNPDMWTDSGDSACNWGLTDNGHNVWAEYVQSVTGRVPNGTGFDASAAIEPLSFYLFAGDTYYPLGACGDYIGAYVSVQAAKDAALSRSMTDGKRFDWCEVVEHTADGLVPVWSSIA